MPDTPQPAPAEKWPPWATAVLEALGQSPNVSYAARAAGVDRRTINRLIQRDETFAVAAHDAKEQALDDLESSILLRARTGMPIEKSVTLHDEKGQPILRPDGTPVVQVTRSTHISDTLAMFFLKRYRPEFREAYRVEQSGPGGGPIHLDVDARITDAVGYFDAEVVRLATDRAEGEDPGSNGSTGGHQRP